MNRIEKRIPVKTLFRIINSILCVEFEKSIELFKIYNAEKI